MLIKRSTISAKDIKTGNKVIICSNCKKTFVDSEIEEAKCPYCKAELANID